MAEASRANSPQLDERLQREREHGQRILDTEEANWGWHTAAGAIRKRRRADFIGFADRPLERGARVLEIGCGSGTFTGSLAERFEHLTAIDISDPLVEAARARHPGVEFRIMDAHSTEFPEASFDAVVGCSVLHHLDWARALEEFHRVLRPGGLLRFSEPNLLNPQIFLQKNWPWLKERLGDSPDEYAFTRWRILRDLQSAGFAERRAEAFEFLHPSVPERLVGSVLRLESVLERTPARHIGGSLKISARKR